MRPGTTLCGTLLLAALAAAAAAQPVQRKLMTDRASAKALYWHGPQSVYVEKVDKTFIAFRGDDADPYILTYDHQTGEPSEPVRVGTNPMHNRDRHGPPSIAIPPDGRIHVFFGSHNTTLQYARSKEPYDIQRWHNRPLDEVPDGTYPCPTVGPEGNVYVLYRTGGRHGPPYPYPSHEYATVIRSENGGERFVDLGPVIDTSGHPDRATDAYVADFDAHHGKLHMSWVLTHGQRHDVRPRDNLSHAVFDPADGRCYTLGGKDLGETIDWAEHEQVSVHDGPANIPRHAFDGDTVYVSFRKRMNGHSEWWVASSDGGAWSAESSGIRVSHRNYGQVRLSDDGRLEMHAISGGFGGKRGGGYTRAVKTQDGWQRRTLIDQNDTVVHALQVPRHSSDELAVLVCEFEGINAYGQRLWGFGAFGQ